MTLRLAAAFLSGLTEPRPHQAAALEPGERRVDGADRDFLAGMFGKLAPNRHAVGVVAEAQDRQEEKVFEASDVVRRH